MKKLLTVSLLFVSLTVLAFGQKIEDLKGASGPQSSDVLSKGIELRIIENGWRQSGGPFSDNSVAALIAQLADDTGFNLSSNTRELLDECAEREQLVRSIWVNQNSPRLETGTLIPSELRWEITTGGSRGDSRSTNVRVGSGSGGLESGSAEAFITIRMKNLRTGLYVPGTTITGKAKYSSTNLTGVEYRQGWFERFGLTTSGGNPEHRRGLVAVANALKDLQVKLKALHPTR